MSTPRPTPPSRAPPTPMDEDDEAREEERLMAEFVNNPEYAANGFKGFGDTVGKADDAVDYEDISDDDDLPMEEEGGSGGGGGADAAGDEDEDMLGDLAAEGAVGVEGNADADADEDDFDELFGNMSDDEAVGAAAVGADGLPDVDAIDFDMDDIGDDLFGDGDLDLSSSPVQTRQVQPEPVMSKEDMARLYFPDFQPHAVLSFSSMFKPKPGTLQMGPQKVPKPLVPTKVSIDMAPDEEAIFNRAHAPRKGHGLDRELRIVTVEPPVEEAEGEEEEEEKKEEGPTIAEDVELEIACDDWDAKIEAASKSPPMMSMMALDSDEELDDFDIISPATKRRKLLDNGLGPRYLEVLPGNWLQDDRIFEGDLSDLASKVVLDLNDPHLLVDIRNPADVRKTRRIGGEFKRRVNRDLTQRYNISNDEAYDLLKENHQNKIRSTIGQLNIEHSLPALRLQSPYYKTKLSTKDARAFHRPTLHFHIDVEIRFDKMKYRKKKSYRGKDIQEVLGTTKDLSLSDGMNFILLEYSEEYPTVLSNFGMGSRLINYYRRKGPDDESRGTKLEVGETHVLMSQDRSPFWNFGTVDPGETVPTLYNKMIRAPVFRQQPKDTDFLVVRSSYDNASRYYLRTIPYVFVVGQLFPVCEVPGPHSRKVTTAAKNRLKMICYRVCKRKEGHAIAVKDISTHFPENNDMQNRQKMKEFMSYQKHTGLWEVKPGEGLTDEAQIRAMVKPEDLCLLEAMQVGLRHLEDSGYSKDDNFEEDSKDAMSFEQQTTPWVSTKNFINATQGKAMLQLHGEGDPSGRGEAFSFMRTSMKGGFRDVGESVDAALDKMRLKELGGHSYNVARQQKQYEEAIDRIWRAQFKSLSSEEEPVDIPEDDEADGNGDGIFDEGRTPGASWLDDETTSQFSRASGKNNVQKVLRITRKVRNKNGQFEEKQEVVTDPKVIRMYLRRRRELDAEKTHVESLVPTGNAEEDQHAKKRLMAELARLQRNKERREARERQSGKRAAGGDAMSPDAASPSTPGGSGGAKQATTRKCANCGQAGHIRTNKKMCPKLNGKWKELGMSPPPTGPGTPGAA